MANNQSSAHFNPLNEKRFFHTGQFRKIYDQGIDETGIPWHCNDHCFCIGLDKTWHAFGITYPDPGYDYNPDGVLFHATAKFLTDSPWEKHPFALTVQKEIGETALWAPHIIHHQGSYYMFYCSGSPDPTMFGISLAISQDLWTWERHTDVLFRDGFQGRDPMVLWIPSEKKWAIYYCATESSSGGHHVVAFRTSSDLIHWSERGLAYIDPAVGTDYGPTESPFVVRQGPFYYLFIGPRPYDPPTPSLPNWEHPGYDGTDVFRSATWNHWTIQDLFGHIPAHALEVVRDTDGEWYVSHAGIKRGGLYLAHFEWNDDLNNQESSLVPADPQVDSMQ